jgi:hypothetical protein
MSSLVRGLFRGGLRKCSWAFSHVVFLLCCLSAITLTSAIGAAQGDAAQPSVQEPSGGAGSSARNTTRTKIAEGEYAIYEEANSGAVGPFGEEVYDFHESWILWRTEKGQYEVEGERRFESPHDVKHDNRFLARLSRDFTPVRMTEFAKLKWRRDSGPLSCEFLAEELHCSSGARDPQQSIELRVPLHHPFGLLWPISPFSLSGLTRETERDLHRPAPVQLLSIEQPSADDPVQPSILDGQLQYLGEEEIEAAAQKWRAYKFSLKVPSHPQFLLWTSAKGLLLALAIEHAHPNWPQEGMRLARFQKWSDF